MATARVSELLKLERAGKLSDQQRADVAVLREAGEFPAQLEGPPSPTAAPARMGTEELLSRGILGSSFGTQAYTTPETSVMPGAVVARTLPGLMPNPLLAGIGSAAGEAVAQAAEQGVGAREGFDQGQIAIAGAAPPAISGVVRGVRAVGRTAQRVLPSLFESAQRRAIDSAAKLVDELTPQQSVKALFQAAQAKGADRLSLPSLRGIVDDLDVVLPSLPEDPGLQQVRGVMEKTIKPLLEGSDTSLTELMRARLDLGRLVRRGGSAPELGALYKGVMTDLEVAASQGGQGATAAKYALDVFKKDLGAIRVSDLIDQSKSVVRLGGADAPALNINRLSTLVSKNREDLTKLLGSDGIKVVDGFVSKFRSLPPTHALTAWNTLMLAAFGGGGAVAGGPVGAVAAAAGVEVGRNMWAVGKNPAALNRFLTIVANSARQLHNLGEPNLRSD